MAQDFPHLSELRGNYLLILKKHYIILLSELFRHQMWSVRVSHVKPGSHY